MKKSNEYAALVASFARIPKAVFAAIAVSKLVNFDEVDHSEVDAAIMKEWATLYENGIVPQKPTRAAIARAEGR